MIIRPVIIALLAVFCFGTVLAVQQKPANCEFGAYVISLSDFEIARDSFRADFWFWSTCKKDIRPLDSIDFPSAKKITKSLSATSKRRGLFWSYVKVSGIFSHDWNVKNFPFDRHRLSVDVEHTAAPIEDFRYTPDKKGSKLGKNVALDGWVIENFGIEDYVYAYDTAFGNPDNGAIEQSEYSRVRLSFSIHRQSVIGFFKLTAGVYISFALVLLSFFLRSELGPRTGLLVGTLFAVLVNQRVADSVLGRVEAFTLVDQIHVIAMVFILIAALIATLSQSLMSRKKENQALKLDRAGVIGCAVSYIVVNIWVIQAAASAG